MVRGKRTAVGIPDLTGFSPHQKWPPPAVTGWLFRGAITEAGNILEMEEGSEDKSTAAQRCLYAAHITHDNCVNRTKWFD